MLELEEHVDQGFDRADPEAAGRHQDRGPVRREAVLHAHGASVLGDPEHGIDRDPRHRDRGRWDAEALQVGARLVEGDEVAVDVAGEPHPLDVEVGHHDRLPGGEPPLRSQPANDLGGQEVGRDHPVRPLALEEADEPRRVQLVERQAQALVLPGDVEVVVEPAEHLGGAVDEVEVGLRVDPAEELARVLEDVDVADLAHPAGGDQGVLERLGRADVTRPGGGGEDEDAVEPGARSRNRSGSDSRLRFTRSLKPGLTETASTSHAGASPV